MLNNIKKRLKIEDLSYKTNNLYNKKPYNNFK